MCTTKPRQAGFSLIELIFFIVVVSVGLAGILMVMDVSVKSSADPMVRKQAMALADSLMEEILLKPFVDPDGVSGETTRATFDDVSDYNGINEVISAAGPVFLSMPANLNGYTVKIDVVNDATTKLGTVAAAKVTVTVSKAGANSISMTGYRTQDPP
jgi:MSHA pilin protein MshD